MARVAHPAPSARPRSGSQRREPERHGMGHRGPRITGRRSLRSRTAFRHHPSMHTPTRSEAVPESPVVPPSSSRPPTSAVAGSCAARDRRRRSRGCGARGMRTRRRPSRPGRTPRSATPRRRRLARRQLGARRLPTRRTDHGGVADALAGRRRRARRRRARGGQALPRRRGGRRWRAGNQPFGDPKTDGDVKVFELTVDKIQHKIDARRTRSTPSASTARGRVRAST